jgi:hypothetical protein
MHGLSAMFPSGTILTATILGMAAYGQIGEEPWEAVLREWQRLLWFGWSALLLPVAVWGAVKAYQAVVWWRSRRQAGALSRSFYIDLLLLLVLWGGTILIRVPFLHAFPIENDELVSVYNYREAKIEVVNGQFGNPDVGSIPPLYRIALNALLSEEVRLAQLRWYMLLIASLGVFPMFFLGRRLGGRWGAIVVASCYALYPASIVYASLLRPYPLMLFLAPWFFFHWYRALEQDEGINASLVLAAHLLAWTHYVGTAIVVLALAGLTAIRLPGKNLASWACLAVWGYGLSFPAYCFLDKGSARVNWDAGGAWAEFGTTFRSFFFHSGIVEPVVAAFFVLGVARVLYMSRQRERRRPVLILLVLAAVAALPAVLDLIGSFVLRTRYYVPLLPFGVYFLYQGTLWRYRRIGQALLVGALLLGYAQGLPSYYRTIHFDRPGFPIHADIRRIIKASPPDIPVIFFDDQQRVFLMMDEPFSRKGNPNEERQFQWAGRSWFRGMGLTPGEFAEMLSSGQYLVYDHECAMNVPWPAEVPRAVLAEAMGFRLSRNF